MEDFLKEKDPFQDSLAAAKRAYTDGNPQNMIEEMAKHMEEHQSMSAYTAWVYCTDEQKGNIN